MRTLLHRSAAAAALALGLLLPDASAHAQALGPQRQFLAIEPYYTRFSLDKDINTVPPNVNSIDIDPGLNGYGARLWINFAPFSGPGNNLLGKSAIALFYTHAPSSGSESVNQVPVSITHYGAQLDYFFVNRPLGGFFDPVISGAVGAYSFDRDDVTDIEGNEIEFEPEKKLALSPSIGFRIPVPNRFQLRFDARDAIVLKGSRDGEGNEKAAHNFEFIGAVGVTF